MKLRSSLTDALKLVLLIGLVVMAFSPSYSYALIRVLYGRKWSDGEAPIVLQCSCLFVIVLAMNGTSEAFLHAVANENQLKHSNGCLIIFSGIYIVLNVLLIHLAGAVGLIVVNSLSVLSKICSLPYPLHLLNSLTTRIWFFEETIFLFFLDYTFKFIMTGSSKQLIICFVGDVSLSFSFSKCSGHVDIEANQAANWMVSYGAITGLDSG